MILDNTLAIEEFLECKLCDASFLQPAIVGECGHRFCLKCIERELRDQSVCPTCQKPVNIKNLRPDSTVENLLVYVEDLKSEFLNHSLTPLELSLNQQRLMIQNHSKQQTTASSQSGETQEDYQIEDSSMDDLHVMAEIASRKRPLPDTNTQDTANNDDELEREFNDSLSQTTTQTAKKLKTVDIHESNDVFTQTAHKPESEKMRLFDPKNILCDIFTSSQDDESQRNGSGTMASADVSSESDIAPFATENQAITAMSQSSQSATANNEIKGFIPDTVYSDSEDNNDDTDMWKCGKCQYDNKPYLQTCGICRTYRNQRVLDMPPLARPTRKQPNDNTATTSDTGKKAYQLTAAADEENAQVAGTLTVPSTRRRSNSSGHKEVHILYTGLTEQDQEKLDKIKQETDQKLKIVIHYDLRNFDEVTHVITSVDKKRLCKRTLKYLQGVLKGKWIVEPKWVIDSTKSKKWQAEDKYEVQGDHLTGKTHAPKLARESQHQLLFQDMKFHFFGDFSGKHNKNDLLKLCKAGGAKILTRKPPGHGRQTDANNHEELDPQEPVVIRSSDEKKHPVWLQQCQVRDPQWIIDCISKFKVE